MSFELVGREQELVALDTFLARAPDGPAALVLEGEAGIGKTTLWQAGVDAASSRAPHVLVARPAEAEQDLLHTGLGDLLKGVLDGVLPALPAPRRQALEVALLLREAEEAQDGRALIAAVHTVLGLLAEAGPVVVAIDDVQWLDSSTVRALEFALRRLQREPISLVIARRVEPDPSPSPLARVLPPEHVERICVGPLSLGALQRLLQTRLERTFPRRTFVRLHDVSGGNPFFALELAESLDAVDTLRDPAEPMPLPETLEAVVHARLDVLPAKTNAALLTVAALGAPPAALVRAAGVRDETLEPAYSTHVIERTDSEVRFVHPLLASAVYAGASSEERQRVHRLLAGVVEEPVSRARHLALGSSLPDGRVAVELDEAAARARARGAVMAAAELGELAVRATPPDATDEGCRRELRAAKDHIAAGDPARAEALADDVVAKAQRGTRHAEALLLLGELRSYGGESSEAIEQFEAALAEAAGDPALQAMIHERLSWLMRLTRGLAEGEHHVRRSLELAEQVGEPLLRSRALSALAQVRRSVPADDALAHAREAVSLAERSGDRSALYQAQTMLADVLFWTGGWDAARGVLRQVRESARERDEVATGDANWYLSLVELWEGRWEDAAEHAERCREIGALYAVDEHETSSDLFPAALVAAYRDDAARARELARRGLELAETKREPAWEHDHHAVLGMVDFREGDPLGAVDSFDAAESLRRSLGLLLEPNMRFYYGDYVEALLELGRIDDAVALLEPWAADAERLGRGWATAHATRCRGLVASARGDSAAALSLLEDAQAKSSAGGPFASARAELALGMVRRRARQKRKAREALEQAIRRFDSLGAPHWSKRASSELARVGGRVPSGVELTPAEQRVAELVSEGKTNREVAGMLFLAERTVEGHLSHIYAKLGVRSRTELSRRLT